MTEVLLAIAIALNAITLIGQRKIFERRIARLEMLWRVRP